MVMPVEPAPVEIAAPVEAVVEAPLEAVTDTLGEGIGDIQVFGGDDEKPVEPVVAPVEPPLPDTTAMGDGPVAPAPVSDADRERQAALAEIDTRNRADEQRNWEQQIVRKAKALEQQLASSGYLPEQAKAQARQFVQQEQRFRKQEKESSDMVGYVQGKQNAALYMMKEQGLATEQMLADFVALQQANSPADMQREAARMKRERALVEENAKLRQGRVAPQTFDNSQGSAEVTNNDDRLLAAYNNGDRSAAATAAAKRLLFR